MRRRIFVGSSTEDLRLANALLRNLVNCGHTVTVWSQGTFSIGRTVFDSLLAALEKVDAAVFVFAPNDQGRTSIHLRCVLCDQPRDERSESSPDSTCRSWGGSALRVARGRRGVGRHVSDGRRPAAVTAPRDKRGSWEQLGPP